MLDADVGHLGEITIMEVDAGRRTMMNDQSIERAPVRQVDRHDTRLLGELVELFGGVGPDHLVAEVGSELGFELATCEIGDVCWFAANDEDDIGHGDLHRSRVGTRILYDKYIAKSILILVFQV